MDDIDQQPHNESKLAVSPDFDAFVIRKSQFAVAYNITLVDNELACVSTLLLGCIFRHFLMLIPLSNNTSMDNVKPMIVSIC